MSTTLRARQKIGKYRIQARIASGPLADVYRAWDTILKRRVALKLPRTGDDDDYEECLHEVRVGGADAWQPIGSVVESARFVEVEARRGAG